ncbi:MAG: tetratricopeptide repeat protein, partial [Anaerolineales bacterium]
TPIRNTQYAIIITGVKRLSNWELLTWILLPIILAPLLGLLPSPAGLDRALKGARQALESDSPLSASEHLVRIAEYLPWRDTLWELAGRSALKGGDPQAAIRYLQIAATHGQITAEGYVALGDAYQQAGDLDVAIETWEVALDHGNEPLEIYYRLLDAHRTMGDYAAAIEDLRTIAQLAPTNAQSRYQLGLMLAARQPEAALDYLIQAMEIDEELTSAVQVLQRSLRPSPKTNDPAYVLLNAGRALAFLDEWALAAEAFYQSTQANPNYAEAWAFLGEAREQLGQDGAAELEKAIELNPESLTANTLYALYQKRHGNPEIALVYLHAAANIKPENPAIQAEIGSTLDVMGDFNTALSHYLRATELAPRDAAYWHLLAFFSLKNSTQIEEIGLAAARQALLLDEDDPIALDLMGYGYYLLGDMVTAQRFLQRSLEINPEYAPAMFHLGLRYLAQGDSSNARKQLLRAIALAPNTPTAEQAARILERYLP